jgi:hypothetical protein
MKITRSFFLCLVLIALAGCATQVGTTTFPEPIAGFTPKDTYAVSYDKLWDATVNALDKNRIAAASMDKASGSIQTDYIEGPSALIAGGFVGAQSTRYKFNLALRNQSDGHVRLNILCKIESTIKGGSGASQWTDVTSQNRERATKLETWLYGEVEKGL